MKFQMYETPFTPLCKRGFLMYKQHTRYKIEK
jgi:hypothetical protein